MASKKVNFGTSSFLMSKNNDTRTENEAESTQNTFVNDGSFLEMYKKRMEEMEKAQKSSKDSVPSTSGDQDTTTQKDSLPSNDKTDNLASSAVKTSVVSQGRKRLMVGRMGGASKQFHAKKKKQEKQAAQEKDSESNKGDNSAWNAYMEEVKKYREGSCTEEVDRIRPLVK
ncbi:telomerase RNA component interacting RNase [Exaiptasia diaphana]|uniref:Telomerase RNA component interacting RNase n=1 Tax=Exaiptasia diaphana TaxID=2652724 RepID=A0A913XBK7_EXADI|nr:telomerase RNA component interacting RNase [Exaiptasia diaphana]